MRPPRREDLKIDRGEFVREGGDGPLRPIARPVTDEELAEIGLVDISNAIPVVNVGGLTGAMYRTGDPDEADGWYVPKKGSQ